MKETMIDQSYEYCLGVREYKPLLDMNFDGKDGFAVDNYPIKAISVPASEHIEIHDDSHHIWNEGTVKTPPTCITDGIKEFTCTVCGADKTEFIPALGHSWSDWTVTKEATKTEQSEKTRVCANCGKKETTSIPVNATEPPVAPTENITVAPTVNNNTNNNAVNTQTANEVSSANVPNTGDTSSLMILVSILLAAFSGISSGTALLKKTRKNK